MTTSLGRYTQWVAAVVVLGTALIGTRVLLTSRAELRSGQEALESGETRAAVTHFRRAVRWYLPLSPYPMTALEELRDLALAAESNGDTPGALFAWRAIHEGLTSARSLGLPHGALRDEADQHIGALMAASEGAQDATAAEYATALSDGPGIHWLALLAIVFGFSGWVFALVRLSGHPTDTGMAHTRTVLAWRVLATVGLVVFMLGLWFG